MRTFFYILGLWGFVALAGCGGGAPEGPPRFRISGTVTYKGEPVPRGKLIFTPDKSRGNSGPQGHATIVNGNFDTNKSGAGVIGGPHMVRIDGFDGVQPSDDIDGQFVDGKVLFSDYQEREDFEKGAATRNYKIPDSAGSSM